MKKLSLFLIICCITVFNYAFSDTVVWSGKVNSNGTPTAIIPLVLGKKYQIKVSGTVNLGKWWQAGKQLEEDAFYEYNNSVEPFKLETLKNSLNLPLSNTPFHKDHLYLSTPFIAPETGIHFWISDIDYSDNTGSLQVQVIELDQNEISRGGGGDGRGGWRDDNLENREDNAEQNGNENREDRLNNELDNSEMRQSERQNSNR